VCCLSSPRSAIAARWIERRICSTSLCFGEGGRRVEQAETWMVWLLQGKPGGGIRGVALCYPNSTLFNGQNFNQGQGLLLGCFFYISLALSRPEPPCVTSYQLCSEPLRLAGSLLGSKPSKASAWLVARKWARCSGGFFQPKLL